MGKIFGLRTVWIGGRAHQAPPMTTVRQAVPAVAQAVPAPDRAARRIAGVLAILLTLVIAVAFRGSWTAHSDAARANHFDTHGAWLYPFAPDGLIVLALISAVVLRHRFWPRVYCLFVVALFTMTSYVVNHLHGRGAFEVHPGTEVLVTPLAPQVTGLIAFQLVGAIAFGSHILMHVFRHLYPQALATGEPPVVVDQESVDDRQEDVAPPVAQPEPALAQVPPAPPMSAEEKAAREYGASLDRREPISERALSEVFGISRRAAASIVVTVISERYIAYIASGGEALTVEDLVTQFGISQARAGEVLAQAEPAVAHHEPTAPERQLHLVPLKAVNGQPYAQTALGAGDV
ncbi:hypothetical protein GCM10022248_86520 [Nonomuraea soli]